MNGGFRNAPPVVISCDGLTQRRFGQHTAKLVAEQVGIGLALTDSHIIPKNEHHITTQGNDLNLFAFGVAEHDLPCVQINVPVLDVADGSRSTTAVHQEIDDNPTAIFTEITVLFRLLQQRLQLRIAVCLFYRVLLADVRHREGTVAS